MPDYNDTCYGDHRDYQMRADPTDPKDPHNLFVPGPRSLGEVHAAKIESLASDLKAKDSENVSLKQRGQELEDALEKLIAGFEHEDAAMSRLHGLRMSKTMHNKVDAAREALRGKP